MKLLRHPGYIAGFLWNDPVKEVPMLTHGGEAISDAGFVVASHQHPAFEFLYLSRGAITWSMKGKTATQQMGDLMVFYPREPHKMAEPAGENTHRIWIGVELEDMGRPGRNLARYLCKHDIRVLTRCQAAEPIMQAIIRQTVSNLPRRDEVILGYLRVLLAVVEQRNRAMQQEEFTVELTQLPYTHAIQKAVSHMERHLNRHIPLAELTSIALCSQVANFCAQFKREVGIPPASYHLQLRLNAAQSKLLQPDTDITSVALEFGFSSSQHFSTAFSQEFGMSPRAWRKSMTGRAEKAV